MNFRTTWFLTLKLTITTIVVFFVICLWFKFKSHFCKQCGPRSDCSSKSSLINLPVRKNRFEKFARIFSRQHKQTFLNVGFLGILRVKRECSDQIRTCTIWYGNSPFEYTPKTLFPTARLILFYFCISLCSFESRFNGPVNRLGSCRAWSVYLTTIFYWAGLVL